MTKATDIFFVASVLCFWIMASLAIAAPPGTPPDIKAMEINTEMGFVPPVGSIVPLRGLYMVTGCIKKPFFGKITLDGTTLIEQEMTNYDPKCNSPMFDGWFSVNWKVTAGAHTIIFTVDSQNDIVEGTINELNNTKTKTFTVPRPAWDHPNIKINK